MNEYRIATEVGSGSNWEMRVNAAVPGMCIPIGVYGPDHPELGRVVAICPNPEIAADVVWALNFAEQYKLRRF